MSMVDDKSLNPDVLFETNPELAIGVISARKLPFGVANGLLCNDRKSIHGTVVWCLMSTGSQTVEYHIDYAELYR